MTAMPVQKPGQSVQDVGTPEDFLGAFEERFGPVTFDLAAHAANHLRPKYFAPRILTRVFDPVKDDAKEVADYLARAGASYSLAIIACEAAAILPKKSKVSVENYDDQHSGWDGLSQDWSKLDGNLWINPEYNNIDPWSRKCSQGGNPVLFVPLSTANWARDHVHDKSHVLGLNPRIVFRGHATAYPKDMMAARFGPSVRNAFECWRWK